MRNSKWLIFGLMGVILLTRFGCSSVSSLEPEGHNSVKFQKREMVSKDSTSSPPQNRADAPIAGEAMKSVVGEAEIHNSPDRKVPPDSPIASLADNTWVYMNPKPSKRWVPKPFDTTGDTFTHVESREPRFREFTGIVMGKSQIFYFGGAHSGYPGNDMEIYDIIKNTWTQMYKPIVPSKGDPMYGSGGSPNIAPSGDPYTFHGYARTAFDPVRNKYVCTNAGGIVEYDPGKNVWEWVAQPGKRNYKKNGGKRPYPAVFSDLPVFPRVGSGEQLSMYDQSLGGFLITGMYNFKGVWLWIPQDSEFDYLGNNGQWLTTSGGAPSVYLPDKKVHIFARLPSGGRPSKLKLLQYDSRENETEVIPLPKALEDVTKIKKIGGISNSGNLIMAYDTRNQELVVLTQRVSSGQPEVWTYNPKTARWKPQATTDESGISSNPTTPKIKGTFTAGKGRSIFQYDQSNNVFFLVIPNGAFVETWAYRLKN